MAAFNKIIGASTPVGGAGRLMFFRLKDDHSGILKNDGTTAATTFDDAVLDIQDNIVKSAFMAKLGFEALCNETGFIQFGTTYGAPEGTPQGGEKVLVESGIEYESVVPNTIPLLAVHFSGKNGAKRTLTAAIGTVDSDWMYFEADGNKYTRAKWNMTRVRARTAVVLATGLIPSGYFTGTPTVTVALNTSQIKAEFAV
jgi:hypothetical protein